MELLLGAHRFDPIQLHLGIARNVLAARLKRLVEHALIEKRQNQAHPPRFEYHLTRQGLDLQRRRKPDPGSSGAAPVRSSHEYLQWRPAELQARGLHVMTEVICREAAAGIMAATREHLADLVVTVTDARTGPDRWLHGSVAEGVVRYSPAPVLLLRAGADETSEPLPPGRPTILVPLDGTACSEGALPVAQAFARQLRGELLLAEAVQVPAGMLELAALTPIDVSADLEALSAEAAAYLRDLAGRLRGEGYSARSLVDAGPALRAVLATEQQERPARVVMATHGRAWPGSSSAVCPQLCCTPAARQSSPSRRGPCSSARSVLARPRVCTRGGSKTSREIIGCPVCLSPIGRRGIWRPRRKRNRQAGTLRSVSARRSMSWSEYSG